MTGKVHFEGKEKPKDAFAKGEVHEELTLIKDHAHGANGRCAQDRPLVRRMMNDLCWFWVRWDVGVCV